MKAIRVHAFGGPEVLRLEEVAAPQAGPGQVVVEMKTVGINPVETYIRAGIYGPRAFPYTPGSDGAGVVRQVGAEVTGWVVGDRVYAAGSVSGTYAEQALCAAASVHRLPERLSYEQGAAIGIPYGTAYYGLFNRGAAKAGETVLIHGASGGVGLAAVQLANRAGLRIIGSAGSDAGKKLVREQGADLVVDHHDAGHWEQVKSYTEGKGVPLIIEMLANQNLGKDLEILAPKGRVVVVGNRGRVEIDPRETMKRDADIRGMSLMNALPGELVEIHRVLGEGFVEGSLTPVVEARFPLADAAKGHVEVMEGKTNGKVVLVVER